MYLLEFTSHFSDSIAAGGPEGTVPLPKISSVAYTLQYCIPEVSEPGLYLYLRYLSLGYTQYEGIVLCVVW